jgi:predicted dienelactone hydrolase
LPVVTLILAASVGTVEAQPAPDSLRVEKSPVAVKLAWQVGTGPYGVYRSTSPDLVVDPANYLAVTDATVLDDVFESASGDVLFYRVDVAPSCRNDGDCDNGNPCDGDEDCVKPGKFCAPGLAAITCDDGDPCSLDWCSPSSGACNQTAPDCDDGNPCTVGSCVPGVGCEYTVASGVGTATEIAGTSLAEYPFVDHALAYNEDAPIEMAVDPNRFPVAGKTCDVYVLEGRDAAGWCRDRTLSDVRGSPDARSFVSGSVRDNTFPLAAAFQLDSDAGTGLGHGYDVAIDCDGDAMLDPDELVDGLSDAAGLYVLHDLTQAGPLATGQFDEIGPAPPHCNLFGGSDDLRVYYPTQLDDPGFDGTYPLVVISHGNGHCFDWYDFLGTHLASYGYIVMSHDNDTMPGIETASTTTLSFTDKILLEQATLGGGVLDGHIDGERIAWIGHSRGGEGVVRAYDRIRDEGFTPQAYGLEDIVVVSSIAPTDFLGPSQSDPGDVNYHLLYGSADGDVCGCPNNSIAQSFGLYERATGYRHSTYVHGADHNDFNCCGTNDFTGPPGTAIGRPEAQQVQKAIHLATLERYLEFNLPAVDLFWRQYESLRPIGVAGTTTVVNEYRVGPDKRGFVLDDYQTWPDPLTSSSGEAVSFSVAALTEAKLAESDGSFGWTGGEPMNGMTRARSSDTTRGVVFEYGSSADAFYELAIAPGERDLTDDRFLSFRAAQGTRHPETTAALDDLTFTVTLIDGQGTSSSIGIGAYGGGLEEPYQRTGFGAGSGWQNEFETIRIRLTDFLTDGSGLDLTDVRFVRFELGASFGSPEGRVALDDVELVE